jgi:hypothetical protein
MATSIIQNNITFEEILGLFTDMDSPEKSVSFKEKLSIFLQSKSDSEKKLIGSIMLSITQDNAAQLLRSIKENGDMELLTLLEKNIKSL